MKTKDLKELMKRDSQLQMDIEESWKKELHKNTEKNMKACLSKLSKKGKNKLPTKEILKIVLVDNNKVELNLIDDFDMLPINVRNKIVTELKVLSMRAEVKLRIDYLEEVKKGDVK